MRERLAIVRPIYVAIEENPFLGVVHVSRGSTVESLDAGHIPVEVVREIRNIEWQTRLARKPQW